MDHFFSALLRFVLRLVMLAAGLVVLAGLFSMAALILLIWLLRAVWARLTGQPVQAWTFKVNRQAVWERFYRPAAAPPRQQSRPVVDADVLDVNVVTDVEPKNSK